MGACNRFLCMSGVAGVVGAWAVIGLSWLVNRSWFVWARDAYSDLGGPGACIPWLYNAGLMVIGLLLAVFGACIVACGVGRLEVVGGSYLALAGVFLALIGVFPSGTRPHTFVSAWFFVQADLGLVAGLAGVARRCGGRLVRGALAASILAFPVAFLVEALWGWPSAAVLETYGILVIDYGVLALWYCYGWRGQSMGPGQPYSR